MQPVDINKKPVRHHLHLPGGLTTQSMRSHDAPQAVHSTPLNHIGLWVDDLPLAVQWLTSQARQLLYTSCPSSYSLFQGVRFAPGGIRKGAAGYDITFLHPKGSADAPISGEGVLIELVQAPAEVIKALS
jgi:lactoylglutathione lyase